MSDAKKKKKRLEIQSSKLNIWQAITITLVFAIIAFYVMPMAVFAGLVIHFHFMEVWWSGLILLLNILVSIITGAIVTMMTTMFVVRLFSSVYRSKIKPALYQIASFVDTTSPPQTEERMLALEREKLLRLSSDQVGSRDHFLNEHLDEKPATNKQ